MSKKTRVFLMIGLTKESEHWDDLFIETLKKKYDGCEVIAMDLPGAGRFLDMKSPLTMGGIVRQTRKSYQEFFQDNDEYNNIMVSISLGGMVSIEWLRIFPKDFQQFVIVNSSLKGICSLTERVQPSAIGKFFKIFLANKAEVKEDLILKLCGNSQEAYTRNYDKWVKLSHDRPMSKENMVRQVVAGAIFNPDFTPQIPFYIIAARHDRLASYTCSQKLHQKWGGKFHLIEDEKVGHGVHIDAPVQLANLIHEWSESAEAN